MGALPVQPGRAATDKGTYNMLAMERFTIASDQPLAPGRRVLRAEFVRDGERPGGSGTLTLFDGDRRVG